MWKGVAICGIWIGLGIAVAGVAFGTGDGDAAAATAMTGGVCALLATIFL